MCLWPSVCDPSTPGGSTNHLFCAFSGWNCPFWHRVRWWVVFCGDLCGFSLEMCCGVCRRVNHITCLHLLIAHTCLCRGCFVSVCARARACVCVSVCVLFILLRPLHYQASSTSVVTTIFGCCAHTYVHVCIKGIVWVRVCTHIGMCVDVYPFLEG